MRDILREMKMRKKMKISRYQLSKININRGRKVDIKSSYQRLILIREEN